MLKLHCTNVFYKQHSSTLKKYIYKKLRGRTNTILSFKNQKHFVHILEKYNSDAGICVNTPLVMLKLIIKRYSLATLEAFVETQKMHDKISSSRLCLAYERAYTGNPEIARYLLLINLDRSAETDRRDNYVRSVTLRQVVVDLLDKSVDDQLFEHYLLLFNKCNENDNFFKTITYSYEQIVETCVTNSNYRILSHYLKHLSESRIKVLRRKYANPKVRDIDLRPYVVQAILLDKLEFADLILDNFNCATDRNDYYLSSMHLKRTIAECTNEPSIESLNYLTDIYNNGRIVMHNTNQRSCLQDDFIMELIQHTVIHEMNRTFVYLINIYVIEAVKFYHKVDKAKQKLIDEVKKIDR